jgi:hypothetical protein
MSGKKRVVVFTAMVSAGIALGLISIESPPLTKMHGED